MVRQSPGEDRRVLVGSWLGSTNLGDELLFRALSLRLTPYCDAITAVSIDADRTARIHGVEAVGHADLRGLVRAAGRSSAFVFGGGDLIQDITSAFNLPYHLARVVLARGRRLPIVGVGLGIPPLRRRWSRPLVRAAWPAAAPLAVRDRGSQEVARALGLEASLAADLVFGLPPPVCDPQDTIAVCLRPWHGGGRSPASASWRAGVDPVMVSALATALDELSDSTGMAMRLVAFQPDRDGPFHDALADRMTATVTSVTPDLDSVLDEVASSRLVVSARYHGAVAGILAGRPVVGLSYADKVGRLRVDAPCSMTVVDHRPDAVAQIVASAERLLEDGPDVAAERDRLRDREAVNAAVIESVLG